MGELLQSAVEAARIGGAVLLAHRGKARAAVDEKGANDFVTEVDRASQAAIVEFLRRRHPDHAILAEEGEDRPGSAGTRWIIDPLDGTTNYIHDYPCFAVSVGAWRGRQGVAGAVLDPVRGELFRAERGAGAWLGDQPIRVSGARGLARSLLVTGFPFRQIERLDEYLRSFRELFRRSAGVRRDGSAALDLCYVACGRLDGFWEMGLSAWDLAAGAVIVQEAGGTVSDYAGRDRFLESGTVIAAPLGLHAEMLEVLRRHHPSPPTSL
jgi:myo-inositol-1(or 4)-monophosphatase